MQDFLREVVRSTNGFGFEVVKVTSTDEGALIEAVNNERTVIMKGKTKAKVQDLEGVFGISNIGVLNGILNLPTFQKDSATVTVEVNANGAPESITFKDGRAKSVYRLMAERAIQKQPNFKAPEWDVTVVPQLTKYQELKATASVFSAVSTRFKPEVQDTALVFSISDGTSSNHNTCIEFADVPSGVELKGSYEYPIDKINTALALCANSTVKLYFSSKGVAQIDVDTGVMELSYIFPGHSG